MDLVYLFDSKNVSLGNSICRYLMFLHVSFFISVYLFHGLVPCLPFFHGQDISFCYTTSENWCSFSRLEYFGFYARGRNVRFFSLAFCTHACLLISRTGILTIFFTLRMFRSVTAYARFFLFRFAYFFHAGLLFLCRCCSDTL